MQRQGTGLRDNSPAVPGLFFDPQILGLGSSSTDGVAGKPSAAWIAVSAGMTDRSFLRGSVFRVLRSQIVTPPSSHPPCSSPVRSSSPCRLQTRYPDSQIPNPVWYGCVPAAGPPPATGNGASRALPESLKCCNIRSLRVEDRLYERSQAHAQHAGTQTTPLGRGSVLHPGHVHRLGRRQGYGKGRQFPSRSGLCR